MSVKITFIISIIFLCVVILQIVNAQDIGSHHLPYTKVLKQAQVKIQNAIKGEIPKNKKVLTSFSLVPEFTQTEFLQSAIDGIRNRKSSGITADRITSSEICFNQSLATVMGIMQGQYWAIKMFDAVDKLPSGILDGNIKLMGSYDACLAITSEIVNTGSGVNLTQYNGQYCWTRIPINIFPGFPLKLDMGICMPDTCSNNDTLQVLNTLLTNIRIGNVPLYSEGVECKEDVGDLDTRAILMIVLCSFFGLLILCGTAYDVIVVRWYNKRQKHEEEKVMKNTMDLESNSMEKRPLLNKPTVSEAYAPGVPGQLLLSFSVYTNGAKLLNTTHGAGTLTCINGIRFISMSWVILGHAVAFGLGTGSNMNSFYPKMIGRWTFQAIANALVSVDTFFALSGLLVSYLALKEMKKNNGRLNWAMFYFHRFWRLTPPYMLILGVYVSLNRYWSDGPLWPEKGIEKDFCKDSWWKNLLYVNNIVENDNQCFGWAWYLANDMQFYILSPLMFVPLYFFNGLGLFSSAAFLLANGISTYFVSVENKLPPTTMGGVDEKTSGDYMSDYYFTPWCRIGPYVVGVVAGYCLYKANGKIKIHWALNLFGWAVATALSITVLYGLHDALNGNPLSIEVAALYNATHRTVWGACVCWVVFACATGNGGYINTLMSWEGFSPLSRLTYCAYLVHPILMFTYFQSLRKPIYFTDMELIVLFLSFLVASMAVAFVASLTFESPMMGLEKVIFKRDKKKVEKK